MDLQKLLCKIDELVSPDGGIKNSVIYKAYCKLAAKLCFQKNSITDAIYYLSEAHGVSLREVCFQQSLISQVRKDFKKTNFVTGLNSEYVSFCSLYSKNKYEGLRRRLKDMPKEWTLVQITRSYNPEERWTKRPAESVPEPAELHIVRYSCGTSDEPCHVLIPEENIVNEGAENLLQLLSESVLDKSLHMNVESAKRVTEKRKHNCSVLKSVTREITSTWLQEWCCFLLGRIYDPQLEESILKSVNEVFAQSKVAVSNHNKQVVLQIVNGCAHLSDDEIESAVSQIIDDALLQKQLTERIMKIKNENGNLISAKRHPVILLIDEKLECVPWEMTPILRRHPVSRLPSVHFVHALFKEHESTIVDGNKLMSDPVLGFYIINPDQSLQGTEQRITQFLNTRFSNWRGLIGAAPSKNDFHEALANYNLLLYCGHGNGTQYMSLTQLTEMKVNALPFLFGCSSVQHKDVGGRVPFNCLANNYLLATSPCTLGMLWTVTSADADHMTVTLLNHWLPGKPIDPNAIEGFKQEIETPCELTFKEPELLRAIKVARDSAVLYFNTCAVVVYGIPVEVVEKRDLKR